MKEGHAMNGRKNAGNQGGNLGETWNESSVVRMQEMRVKIRTNYDGNCLFL